MLLAVLKKEILLTLRDIHALAVLFAMPVAFILVMSLALQETDKDQPQQFDVGLVFLSETDQQSPEALQLKSSSEFKYIEYTKQEVFTENAESDQLIAGVIVPQNFFSKLLEDDSVSSEPVEIYYQPTTPLALRKLLLASLRQSIAAIMLEKRLAKEVDDPFLRKGMRDKFMAKNLIIAFTSAHSNTAKMPRRKFKGYEITGMRSL